MAARRGSRAETVFIHDLDFTVPFQESLTALADQYPECVSTEIIAQTGTEACSGQVAFGPGMVAGSSLIRADGDSEQASPVIFGGLSRRRHSTDISLWSAWFAAGAQLGQCRVSGARAR